MKNPTRLPSAVYAALSREAAADPVLVAVGEAAAADLAGRV
jgi:hypothetical protein